MLNFQFSSQQRIGAGNRLMGVNAGAAISPRTQDVGMQMVFDRRATLPCNQKAVTQTQHADILGSHCVVIGG